MKMFLTFMIMTFLLAVTVTVGTVYAEQIPDWVRNTAAWWGDGSISDSEFFVLLQFLIDREIITVQGGNSQSVAYLEAELESTKAELESTKAELESTKADAAMDVMNAWNDGYDAGLAETSQNNSVGDYVEPHVSPAGMVIQTVDGASVPGCEDTPAGCYIPNILNVQVGTQVIFTNMDTAAHTFTSGDAMMGLDGFFDSSLVMPENSYSWLPNYVGEYEYFCLIHPWMHGTIIVH